MKKSIIAFSLATVFVLSTQTQAAVTLSTPSGLAAGDTFRFIFVTQGTITPTSADISTYDTFVNSQAGGAQYQGATISWKSIISTLTIDARNHVGGFDTNVPVFGGDGTKIANSMTTNGPGNGLWSTIFGAPGNGILASPARGVDGTLVTGDVWVWTGSNSDGTRDATYHVGNSTGLTVNGYVSTSGLPAGLSWLDGNNGLSTTSNRVYGISEELTVIPEPSSLGLLALGAFGLVARRKR
jgi:hypothetical protein